MPWPDIFFKSKKPRADEPPPSLNPATDDAPKPPPPLPGNLQPPTVKPVPQASAVQSPPVTLPVKIGPPPPGTGTRTLPAMHGVILRPPARLNTTTMLSMPPATPPPEPIKNIEQLMAEADPIETLRKTGSVQMVKHPELETDKLPPAPPSAPANTEPSSIKADPALPGSAPIAPAPVGVAPPQPPPAPTWPAMARKVGTTSLPPSASILGTTTPLRGPRSGDTAFMPRPTVSLASTRKLIGPTTPPPMIPIGPITRRKANLADVARIVLPPKREESEPATPPPLVAAPTVIPPSFSVTAQPVRAEESKPVEQPVAVAPSAPESPFLERAETKPVEIEAKVEPTPEPAAPIENESADTLPLFPEQPKVDPEAHKPSPAPEAIIEPAPQLDPEAHKEKPPVEPAPEKPAESLAVVTEPAAPIEIKPSDTSAIFTEPPKVDPEAHKPAPTEAAPEPAPQVDPEAHKETPPPVVAPELPKAEEPLVEPVKEEVKPEPAITTELAPSAPAKEKREFHLTNGEKVAGVVLSETPEAVYIEHGTLGVVTIPRNEIAKRLVEIILINGDRIVGDIMAETADMLYVRHASLGMLSVPRAQRSTRVVEAILTDGDRILGEVLTETDTFTVIKSATLGTVTIPHEKLSMLNRKIEQIQLKALPMSAQPALPDKSQA